MPWEIFLLPAALAFIFGFFGGIRFSKREEDNEE